MGGQSNEFDFSLKVLKYTCMDVYAYRMCKCTVKYVIVISTIV